LISLLLALLAQVFFTLELGVFPGCLLYLLAAYIFSRSLRGYEDDDFAAFDNGFPLASPGAKKRFEWVAFLALLLIASFFRLYRIDSQPISLWLDESLTGLNALEIIEGKPAPIWQMTPLDRWRPDWVKTSNLYLHYTVWVLNIFGTGYFGLKMVSLLPAIAGVGAAYFLFKEVSNPPIAFLSAFLVAVSQWHVTISRWGWDAVLMSFLQLGSYYYLIRGVKSGEKLQFVVSGAVMGLCLYTYVASWIAAAIALTFLLLRAVRERNVLSTRLRDLFFFLTACLLVFAPLSVHYLQNPGDLTVRASEVSLAKTVEETGSYFPLWENFRNYALMFNYKGDKNPRHGFPNEPTMDFVASIFFVLGLTYYGYFWKKSHNVFLLLWFALGLLPGLLSEPSTSPHAFRTFIISPAAHFFAATAFYLSLCTLTKTLWNFRYKEVTVQIFCLGLLGIIACANYWTYFISRPKSRDVWEEEVRDGRLPSRSHLRQRDSSIILVDPLLLWKIVVTNSWYLSYRPGKSFESSFLPANLLIGGSKLDQISGEHQLIYFYSPVFGRMIRSLFPDAVNETVSSPAGEPIYGELRIAVSGLRSRLQSVEKNSLAMAIAKTAFFYKQQAEADTEGGPRRRYLLDESKIGFQLSRELDPRLQKEATR
jgi:hypothetical protein